MKKEMLCPKCGKKMSLVAAGYYCMKDDYVIDPVTGKPPVTPECIAWSVGDRKSVDVFFEEDHLVIKDSTTVLYDIRAKEIEELELGETSTADLGSIAVGWLALGLLGALAASGGRVTTLKVTYVTNTGMRTNLTLATNGAAYLSRKIDSLRGMSGSVPQQPARQPAEPAVREIIREKEVIIKVRCPYCGKLYNEVLDVCPHCGGKR